jgi:phenylalanyl-tRNA synthetase beta chain
LNTDASFRFERGIDPGGVIYCLKLAAMMMKELAGGMISSEIKDVYAAPVQDFIVELGYNKVYSLTGKVIPTEIIKSIIISLEIKILAETKEGLTLAVSPYRVDVQRDVDVIEEILRIYGYDNIEISNSIHSSLITKGDTDREYKFQNLVSEQLVGCGFEEIINNSLTRAVYYQDLEVFPSSNLVMLLNPLSNDLNGLRQTLLFGGLESIGYNINRRNEDLKFFEFGNCYYFSQGKKVKGEALSAYWEEYHLGMWLTGKRVSGSWAHIDENSSIYELKAYIENIFTRMGIDFRLFVMESLSNSIYSTGLSIGTKNGKCLGTWGVIAKKCLKFFDIDSEVYYAELNWKELMRVVHSSKGVAYKELPKFPSVKRDVALLIDKDTPFAEIERIAYKTEKKLLREVSLFDVYEGKNLEPGKRSYAVSFLFQDETRTLTDAIVDKIMEGLVRNFEDRLGAKQR